MEHVGCVSTDLKKNTKTHKIQRGLPLCCLGLTTRLQQNPKYTTTKNPNKTSPQYCLLAHLHQGVKKYKNTQWLTIFFLVFVVKKHKIT